MDLSVTNIAWDAKDDRRMYAALRDLGYAGVELAPTRCFPDAPYDRLDEAEALAAGLRETYGLSVPSLLSILYGRPERISASARDRAALLACARGAVDFAGAVRCPSLVFGCPKNRRVERGEDPAAVTRFLEELASYAGTRGVCVSLEANPAAYGTNYCNSTRDAAAVLRELDSPALGLNLDFATIIANGESVEDVRSYAPLIRHVHISELHMAPVLRRPEHRRLREILEECGYGGFISLEMRKPQREEQLLDALRYVREVFA